MGTKKTSYEALYQRSYRKRNPEKQEQWRTASEVNHLKKLGYTVTPPAHVARATTDEERNGGVVE